MAVHKDVCNKSGMNTGSKSWNCRRYWEAPGFVPCLKADAGSWAQAWLTSTYFNIFNLNVMTCDEEVKICQDRFSLDFWLSFLYTFSPQWVATLRQAQWELYSTCMINKGDLWDCHGLPIFPIAVLVFPQKMVGLKTASYESMRDIARHTTGNARFDTVWCFPRSIWIPSPGRVLVARVDYVQLGHVIEQVHPCHQLLGC